MAVDIEKYNEILYYSLISFQKEQNRIIVGELNNLNTIIKFFSKQEKKIQNRKLPRNIDKDIEILITNVLNIETLLNEYKVFSEKNALILAILYDKNKKEYVEIYKKLNFITKSIEQNLFDSLNQFIPRPFLGKKYSSKALITKLNDYHENLFLNITNKKMEFKVNTFWDFNDKFLCDISSKYSDNSYISFPYGYYELPYILPVMMHECSHIILKNTDVFKDLLDDMDDNLRFILDYKIKGTIHDTSFNRLNEIVNTREYAEDIVSDIISLKVYGLSYLLTFFHIAYGFDIHNEGVIVSNDDFDDFKISNWNFTTDKDFLILRFTFLLSILELGNDEENKAIIESIRWYLQLFDIKNDNPHSLNTLIKESPYTKKYDVIYKSYETNRSIVELLLENLSKIYDKEYLDNLISLKIEDFKTIDFNRLWHNRFNNLNKNQNIVPDKSEFRKILHSFLDNTDSKPYILKYIKMRTDKEFDLTKIGNELKENDIYNCYGLFNYVTICKQDENICLDIEDLKLNSKLDNYYTINHSLMKYTHISGKNEDSENLVNCFLHIELKDSVIFDINKYKTFIEKYDKLFGYVNIYKSLGPKDLILEFRKITLDNIYYIKEQIFQDVGDNVGRTYTNIFSELDRKIIVSDNIRITSILRLRLDYSNKVMDLLKEKEYLEVYFTSGVTDLNIIWDTKNLKDVLNFHKLLIDKKYTTDLKIKINQIKYSKVKKGVVQDKSLT
ncbi:hypothetical protein N5U22_09615 [Aliarcobacter cryaerophilus]|uniref:hypothetical protein n=1 Tax=Aliarcobacter cryaerophilus TaxID=28198 RepID=UPI0021B6144B|nr:hypothetical protein [Aliarcobacter cryaerophilus]MCT7533669.1 hypothetical protein [Aliarcobacter cryaerophilus]